MGEKLQTRKKHLLTEQVEKQILDMIRQQPVDIGERIPNEFELAETFEVGRGTVREAVKSLVSKGILEVRRGRGTYVKNTSTLEEDPLGIGKLVEDQYELAIQLCDVRLMFEPEIAALASMRATPEEKQKLQELCNAVEQIYLKNQDHTEKDVEFHNYIAKCSKNRVIEELLPLIQSAVVTFVDLTNSKLKDETIITHRAITAAIVNGDSIGARNAMIAHLDYNRREIMQHKHIAEEKNKMRG